MSNINYFSEVQIRAVYSPPTEKQLAFLEKLEYKGPPPKTRLQASQIIRTRRDRWFASPPAKYRE
jgi:hypothetical protein